MKPEILVALSKHTELCNHLAVDSAEGIETSIARLIEENATLRRLAAQLSSELELARGLAASKDQQSSQ
jgi:hypothetical protein